MASLISTIGRPNTEDHSGARRSLVWSNLNIPVPASLLADPTQTAYVRYLEFRFFDVGTPPRNYRYRLRLSTTSGGGASFAGPELSNAWENHLQALKVVSGTDSIILTGSTHSSVLSPAPEEPYDVTYPHGSAAANAIRDFIAGYRFNTDDEKDATTLTLDDGVAPPDTAAPEVMASANPTTVNEGGAITLSVTVPPGAWDEIDSVAWTDEAGTQVGTGQSLNIVAPQVTSDTPKDYTAVVVVSGNGTNAANGTTDTATDTVRVTVRYIRPIAVAPTVALQMVTSVAETDTLDLTATLDGGIYDVYTTAFSILNDDGSMGTIAAVAGEKLRARYTPPDVATNLPVTVRIDVNVSGNGETAIDLSTDTASDTESFTVLYVAPAAAPEEIAQSRAMALASDEPYYALEITHPDIATPIRVIAATEEHTIEGNTYLPLSFTVRLPNDSEEEVRHAVIQLDNVGRTLTTWIEQTQGGSGAMMRAMEIITVGGADRIYSEITMGVGVTEYDNRQVSITLAEEPIIGRPGVLVRHDPDTSPGLF